jgi:polysaccharide pyruvyl transferase WcaK-like protein
VDRIGLFLKVNTIGKKSISSYFNDDGFLNVSFVLDLSEGDSFTDIYGTLRFGSITLSKFIFLKITKRYILLPQTIGPFNNILFEKIAAYVIKRCELVIARDLDSKNYAEKISGRDCLFCNDMAFALTPQRIESSKEDFKDRIGINVSGLLWDGGYTGNNQFNLKGDYQNLLIDIATYFIKTGYKIILIPHTYGEGNEDDLIACEKLKDMLKENGNTIEIISEKYNEQEIKWIISDLDFFIGSRMHSCIAALSMGVPAIGIAYSRKFKGVFDSLEVGDLVLDPRILDNVEIMDQIERIYTNRSLYHDKISSAMPAAIDNIHKTLEKILGVCE